MDKFYPIHSSKLEIFVLTKQENDDEKEYQGKIYTYIGNREKHYSLLKRFRVGFISLIKRVGALFNLCNYLAEDWQASVTGKRLIRVYREKNPLNEQSRNQQRMNDPQIIDNLRLQGFMEPIECGSDGSCLLHSIAPQIEERDMLGPQWREWVAFGKSQRANKLREIAMAEEKEFILTIDGKGVESLPDDERVWIEEFYKDIRQEFGASSAGIRTDAKETSFIEKLRYVREQFILYQERTSQPNNWTGTSEMIALSRVLKRPVEMYGNDFASSEYVTLEKGRVQPYFRRAIGEGVPIRIFQTGGGGHYRQLKTLSGEFPDSL
ncbi:MAG: hypothetical protein ACHQUC_06185 [Chlamydiales bacterium]